MASFDSFEVEKLRKLIAQKKNYLQKISDSSSFSYKATQSEIMFLENNVLPILLRATSIVHLEFVQSVTSFYDKAIEKKCNGILIYQPIDENYTDRPIIGVVNNRANQQFGSFGAIEIYVDNMDGNGAKVKPINLLLNEQ